MSDFVGTHGIYSSMMASSTITTNGMNNKLRSSVSGLRSSITPPSPSPRNLVLALLMVSARGVPEFFWMSYDFDGTAQVGSYF